jgi:glycosyltransferase involved in cell wall biosynthesis
VKVCLVHNAYGALSGEEVVVDATAAVLREHGHVVVTFFRSSAEIPRMRLGKARALFSGIYSFASRRRMRELLRRERPDVVHVHNVFPLISPSVLPVCRQAGAAVVMTTHNYRLACPTGLHVSGGSVCQRCRTGGELWCAARNCAGSLPKSVGYAVRNYVARKRRFFLDNVDVFATLTAFQRDRLIADGVAPERIAVVPNMAGADGAAAGEPRRGDYVAFVGRLSPEKGVDCLLAAARKSGHIPFRLAGGYQAMPDLPARTPANVELAGHLDRPALADFYASARMIVLPSVWYEGFPMTIVEAMLHGKAVVCSRIGGLGEIVDHGRTGLVFAPGDADELAAKIRLLWADEALCRRMGQGGREKAAREYSVERYYERLMAAYERAIELAGRRAAGACPTRAAARPHAALGIVAEEARG